MTTRWGILGRALAVTLTAGVTLGVAGCGNEGHSGSASSSAVKTSSSSVLSKSEIIPESYRAAVEAGSAHLTMTTTGQAAMKAQGDVSYAGGSSRMQMTLTLPQMGSGKRMEMRYVGKVLYLQIPFVTQPGKFVALDPSDRRSLLAKSFAGWGARLDPLSIMKAMQGAVKSADRVGGGSIGGTAVDHYKVVMDPAKVLEAKGRQVPVGRAGLVHLRPVARPAAPAPEDGLRLLRNRLRGAADEVGRAGHGAAPGRGRRREGAGVLAPVTGQRPRWLPRMPFIEVGIGPLGIGIAERLASSALMRASTSVIWAGLRSRPSLVTCLVSLPSGT